MVNKLVNIFATLAAIGASVTLNSKEKLKQGNPNIFPLNIQPNTFMPSLDMSTHSLVAASPYLISINSTFTWVYDIDCIQSSVASQPSCSANSTNTLDLFNATKDQSKGWTPVPFAITQPHDGFTFSGNQI
jgi:hypothetical protein